MSDLLWWVFASVAIGGALGTVTRRNPIASLMFLVLTFFALAGIYVLLNAHFIAAAQVIVYTGAILVLFLFVIMLLNLGHDYRSDVRSGGWILVSFVAAGLIGAAVSRAVSDPAAIAAGTGQQDIEASLAQLNAVGAIGQPLFREFVIAFELTSILLLVAIVGAVLLAKRRV
jgi:NADH-quinone oxidoreductase subunit J